jgi:predicted PurR-regulated permease PerM
MDLSKANIKKILGIITFAIVLYAVMLNLKTVASVLGYVVSLLKPFIVGLCIAFILNVIMRQIEDYLKKRLEQFNNTETTSKFEKWIRPISLLSSIAIVVAMVWILLFLIIPEFKNTFEIVSEEFPGFMKKFQQWIGVILASLPFEINSIAFSDLNWEKIGQWISQFLSRGSSALFNTTIGITSSIFSAVLNFVLGLVFAIYVLLQKEKLAQQFKKLFYAYLPEDVVVEILDVAKLSNGIFSSFVTGQFLEAVIIGVLCFIGMLILRLPYALVVSALVGFTALIPVFGAFIGTIVGVFLILMVSPIKALWFVIFFLVLQQLEGNLIYPKVVGGSIGLPSIWVLVAVTLGGSAYGVLGMLLGVPLSSVLYSLLRKSVHKRLAKKEIEPDSV